MKRIFYILFFQLFFIFSAFATHERAGEIIYTHINGLTYEFRIITYTYAPSPADRPELEIQWGDGTSEIIPRVVKIDLTPEIRRNEYVGQHTYASGGGGAFKISVEDPNRNYGIVNIPNSVNIPFYIETELVINPFLGANNSVVLLNPPLDYGCVNRLYIHNPNAWDPDGDSLSYKLTVCRGAGGQPIPGFELPAASNSFTIDEYSGNLVWNTPIVQGEYNAAFIVEEWRSGVRIGYVTRDLQILVAACENEPPEILPVPDTCVVAGDQLDLEFTANDPNFDTLVLTATGSPFLQNSNPATISPDPAIGIGTVSAQFSWLTDCSHVRKSPHTVYLKAQDLSSEISLSSYSAANITVIAPAPEIYDAVPIGTTITLKWSPSVCENAIGYYIYRKNAYYGFVPDYCETGVPGYTGYQKIAEVSSLNDTVFVDDNEGAGLVHGIEYCYMVTAFFMDGAESKASLEQCAILIKDLPVITNVSIESTSVNSGEVYVAWSKPTELDTTITPGPYQYKILRQDISTGNEFIELETYFNLNDTIYYDEQINTLDNQLRYKIEFYNSDPQNFFYIGSTVAAPSVFLNAEGSDRSVLLSWNNNVPWINDEFVIYRLNENTQLFDSIGMANESAFADTGLLNGVEYCYKVKTIGKYSAPGIIDPIINYSQENCGIPIDNVPPCTPELSLEVNCLELVNYLTWTYPDSCSSEELKFYIYYAPTEASDYTIIDSTDLLYNPDDYNYTFITEPLSVVGCFSITALDSIGNQSLFSNAICIDINECGQMWFPNVFTPNSDGSNDFFRGDSINSVYSFDFRIFNRWGLIVYETEDPFFKWDGTDQNNGNDCAEGVYFYEGIVSEYSLFGPFERRVRGNVTLLR